MHKQAELILNWKKSKGTISPMLYGHFAEHIGGVFYDGIWVGEDSPVENIHGFRKAFIESFRKLHPPVLRWPGGCFAETYDWRDGIGPREKRPRRAGWWYYEDRRVETNQVGTHEFMELCRLVGAKPYIAANMTTTTPLSIRNWMEYCNLPAGETTLSDERAANGSPGPFGVEYWGIGNENWGGGGHMTPEKCVQEYLRYSTVCRSLGLPEQKYILCGANGHDYAWTRRVMQECRAQLGTEAPAWGLGTHYYCQTAGTPQNFTGEQWYQQLFQADRMREIIQNHRAAMEEFDPDCRMGLVIDEWGCWHQEGTGPSKGRNLFEQQSTMRDAMVAALTLNLFNNSCDVVWMANVAQLCNNLHSLYLAGGEHLAETPNYHVFHMFQTHMGARQIHTEVNCETLQEDGFRPLETLSASVSETAERITLTLANLDRENPQCVRLLDADGQCTGSGTMTILQHEDLHACNTFEAPRTVVPVQRPVTLAKGGSVEVPPAGIVSIVLKKS